MLSKLASLINRITKGKAADIHVVRTVYGKIYRLTHHPGERELSRYEFDSYELYLDESLHHQRKILAGHERAAKEWAVEYLNHVENPVVYDIGANIGAWTIHLSVKCEKSTVIAIEPETNAFTQLRRNIELNDLTDKVYCERVAIGNQTGTVDLRISSTNNQATHSLRKASHHGRTTESVEMRTLKDLIERYPVPDLIKIDVEGAEVAVLQGMEGLEISPAFIIDIHQRPLDVLATPHEIDWFLEQLNDYGELFQEHYGEIVPVSLENLHRPTTVIVEPLRG